MPYHISFEKWVNPKHEDISGYNAWDYLSGTPGTFETKSEAATWLRKHHKGKDGYRVNAKFRIAKGSQNPRQPHRRVRKALKKYVKSQNVGLPKQYTPAQVRVDSKGEIDIKFARPPKGATRNPKRFKVTRKR